MTGTYNGQDWATHTMSLLLSNTYSLYGPALELAQEDSSGEALGQWVGEWFWVDVTYMGISDGDAVEATRNDMSRNEFDRIDWKSVASDLTTE